MTPRAAVPQRALDRPERAALARLVAGKVPHLGRFVDFAEPRREESVLDLSYGSGPLPALLGPMVSDVTACDVAGHPEPTRPDQPAVQPGDGRRTPTLVFALRGPRPTPTDATALPYDDGAFSLVTAHFSLYRTVDPVTALREMFRVCSPQGGHVVIADLVRSNRSTPDRCNGIERILDPDHPDTPPLATLLDMIDQAGGEVTRLEMFTVERPLTPWLGKAAKTSTGRHIRKILTQEVDGGRRTGAKPRVIGGELWFAQTRIHLAATPKS